MGPDSKMVTQNSLFKCTPPRRRSTSGSALLDIFIFRGITIWVTSHSRKTAEGGRFYCGQRTFSGSSRVQLTQAAVLRSIQFKIKQLYIC